MQLIESQVLLFFFPPSKVIIAMSLIQELVMSMRKVSGIRISEFLLLLCDLEWIFSLGDLVLVTAKWGGWLRPSLSTSTLPFTLSDLLTPLHLGPFFKVHHVDNWKTEGNWIWELEISWDLEKELFNIPAGALGPSQRGSRPGLCQLFVVSMNIVVNLLCTFEWEACKRL